MQLQNHIISNIPCFQVDDSLGKVVQFFNGSAFSHVAVVEGGKFVGTLSENDLENFESDQPIADHRYYLESVFVEQQTGWFDVLEAFARNEANLLPVIDQQGRVLGYYDLTDIVGVFIATPFFTDPGGILVVAKGIKDYSFSEMAQIVESNNARLIGGFVTDIRNDVVQVTLKIGSSHLNEIIQTFRRYNYNILFGNHDDQFLENLKERSDYLDKYLNP